MEMLIFFLLAITAFSTAVIVGRRFQNSGPAFLIGNGAGISILIIGFVVLTFATSLSLLATPF